MIFDCTIIPFVLAGKTTTTTLPLDRKRLPRKGRSYAIRSRRRVLNDDGSLKHTKITTVTRVIVSAVEKTTDAWIITFQLDSAAPPQLMHQQSERGYTTQRREALDPDADAVEPYILEQYAKANWQRFEQLRAQERQREEARSLAAKLREGEARARKQGIDIRDELSHIDATIDRVNQKLRRAA